MHKYKAEDFSVSSCSSSAGCRWIGHGSYPSKGGKGCQVPPVSPVTCWTLGEDEEGTLFE